MKAATEFFHKDSSSSQASLESQRSKASSTRSLSPKKSVRFRSGTFSNDSAATSSPIDVPTKSTPGLLHLKLPSGDFLREVTRDTIQDPIPTGRPQDSPILKDKNDSDYFFPFPTEIDDKLNQLKGDRGKSRPLPLIDLKQRASDLENPFDDAAAISPSPNTVSDETKGTDNADETSVLPTGSPVKTSVEEEWSQFSLSKPPDHTSHHSCAESESNITNPFESASSLQALAAPLSSPVDAIVASGSGVAETGDNSAKLPSAWDLESRTVQQSARPGQHGSDDEDNSDNSEDTMSHLRRRSAPTHEDIRDQFRTRRSREQPQPLNPSTLQGDQLQDLIGPPSDPVEHSPDTSAIPSSPSRPAVVPDGAVSPLNLASTISTTPARARRPFRFSNQTPPGVPPADIGTSRSGWEGHKFPLQVYGHEKTFEDDAPSPVAIPLPLSVAPQQRGRTKWRDQHGWTPFDETRFPEAFLASQDIHDVLYELLRRPGGFAQAWNILGLPNITAPEDDTRALNSVAINEMLRCCTSTCAADKSSHTTFGPPFRHRNSMSELFSPKTSDDVNPFSVLANQYRHPDEMTTIDDGSVILEFPSLVRSPRKYSGEVSTINDSSGDTDHSSSLTVCSQCKSQNGFCRCSESTQTSTEPEDVEAGSGGASSDMRKQDSTRTPTKLVDQSTTIKSGSVETTPRQRDLSKREFRLPIRERSLATTESSVADSDDEQYVKGII